VRNEYDKPFKIELVSFIVALIASSVGLATFAYQNFETKDEAARTNRFTEDKAQGFDKRLDRIEGKIDQILQGGRK
jgi:hypothetical protein